ncbi:MAG: hypothetical protein GC190_15305 [Alphaproteobacteria bacterium]|nr:hypothetical protein [Alphaproteobacteria bacterium]
MRAAPFVLALAAFVAACAELGDTFEVTPFLREQITGDTWRACLAREYQVQTRFVLREGRDWAEASRFSSKGWAALRNEAVPAWQVGEFDLTMGRKAALAPARADLEAVLAKRDVAPCDCAKAQGAFDGWLAASARLAEDESMLAKRFSDAVGSCRQGVTASR